ncbi:MAG: serine/threonine-protein kinase [Kofleriaceae bacterium]
MPSYQVVPNETAPARLGRYELLGRLATGGMAEIHLARLAGEAGFEKIVVVKRLAPELVASPAYVAMFLEEGKLVARLDHPNICEVHELGRDGAEYYLAMPYLDGIAVHELIARPRDADRLPGLRVAAGVIAQACEGLHHAHELRDADGGPANLVHRDVSPSNLFVTASGVVKVLDFGIAKVRGGTETELGTIKGKQQYMAPEQVLGEPLDRRCDVFALGIVLFELVTHQRLFKRASDYLTAKAILEEPIPRADAVDPAVPAALAGVIAKALARDKADRYATARELGTALAAAIDLAAAAAIAGTVTSTDELSAQRTRQARVLAMATARTTAVPRRKPFAIAALMVALIAMLIVAIAVKPWQDDTTLTPPPRVAVTQPPPPPAVLPDAPVAEIEMPADIARVPKQAPGWLSIDSKPYATIWVDGGSLGVTPVVKRSLAAGRHRVRAVLADGRSREFSVEIPPGRLAQPIQLTW